MSRNRSTDSTTPPPTTVEIPANVHEAGGALEVTVRQMDGAAWATAAMVWAFTDEQPGKRTDKEQKPDDSKLSLAEFSRLGIRGLKSTHTVRKYRKTWQYAIEHDWATPALPGETIELPNQAFDEAAEAASTEHTPRMEGDAKITKIKKLIDSIQNEAIVAGAWLGMDITPQLTDLAEAASFATAAHNGVAPIQNKLAAPNLQATAKIPEMVKIIKSLAVAERTPYPEEAVTAYDRAIKKLTRLRDEAAKGTSREAKPEDDLFESVDRALAEIGAVA